MLGAERRLANRQREFDALPLGHQIDIKAVSRPKGRALAHTAERGENVGSNASSGLRPKSTLLGGRRRVAFSCPFFNGTGYSTGHGSPRLRGQPHGAARPPLVGDDAWGDGAGVSTLPDRAATFQARPERAHRLSPSSGERDPCDRCECPRCAGREQRQACPFLASVSSTSGPLRGRLSKERI